MPLVTLCDAIRNFAPLRQTQAAITQPQLTQRAVNAHTKTGKAPQADEPQVRIPARSVGSSLLAGGSASPSPCARSPHARNRTTLAEAPTSLEVGAFCLAFSTYLRTPPYPNILGIPSACEDINPCSFQDINIYTEYIFSRKSAVKQRIANRN